MEKQAEAVQNGVEGRGEVLPDPVSISIHRRRESVITSELYPLIQRNRDFVILMKLYKEHF